MSDFRFPTFTWFIGIIEDVNDPDMLGRLKVRIYGYHSDSLSEMATEDLPWASVMSPVTSAAISGIGNSNTGLVKGTTVVGFFSDGENAEVPIIMGTLAGAPSKSEEKNKGFQDPDGVYPKYKDGESDLNRLARGITKDTIIEQKNKNTTGNEPKSPYAAKYPYNNVRETISGHIEEFDDTPGHERIHRYHKAGTFEEIHPDGTRVLRVVKNNYDIIFSDNSVQVKGNFNIKVDGDYTVTAGGDIKISAGGSMNIKSGSNMTLKGSTISLN
ncbi:MAG: hypothetical protein PHC28_05960 [Flavobacterium sp.]|uniref:hypothetical protein n=1 Tax=Flavobacterium sp. TaxID=239 RepID=UPI0026143B34|nr:hypothetical protein [Flavobacterium sp.]MDD5150014.1 hypothetical protein [Flavobacterium sp.]